MDHVLQRILYVEDDEDFHEIAKLALEVFGSYTLKVCISGPDAIRSAAAFAPDLMLLDAMMPGMDGPATFKELREIPQLASVPIIFMTANASPREVEQFMKLGAADVIPKPFDPMTLAHTIQKIWVKINGRQGETAGTGPDVTGCQNYRDVLD